MKKIPFNWINWQQVLLDDPRPSFHAKSIGLFLHTYMNSTNDMAFPSVATIMGRMNIGSDKTVTKYTNELEKYGYLQKHKRFGKSVQYIAIIPDFIEKSLQNAEITSIVPDTKLTVSHDVRSSIVPDTIPVSHDVRSNNQVNNQELTIKGSAVEIPTSINREAWDKFDAHRNSTARLRRDWTDAAKAIAVKKLKHLTAEQQLKCVENSILGGYPGLYTEKFTSERKNDKRIGINESLADIHNDIINGNF